MPLENFDEAALLATQNDRARREGWLCGLAVRDTYRGSYSVGSHSV
jgi:hypothetical protein